MHDWMWFVCIMTGLILSAACTSKWIDATNKISQILKEELDKNDAQNNSEDR